MTSVTLIDNYDFFTFNLVHYLGALGAEVKVLRNDQARVEDDHWRRAGLPSCCRPAPAPRTRRASAST